MKDRKTTSGEGQTVQETGKWRNRVEREVKEREPGQCLSLYRQVVLWEVLIICRVATGSRRGQRSASWLMGVSAIHQSELWEQSKKRRNILLVHTWIIENAYRHPVARSSHLLYGYDVWMYWFYRNVPTDTIQQCVFIIHSSKWVSGFKSYLKDEWNS